MRLVCGRCYLVTVRLAPSKNREHWAEVKLRYCGGGFLDEEGHEVGGAGVWCHPSTEHPNIRYFHDLPVMLIRNVPPPPDARAEHVERVARKAETRREVMKYRRTMEETERVHRHNLAVERELSGNGWGGPVEPPF